MQKMKELSEAAPVLIAVVFLAVPVFLLLRIARAERVPNEDYARAVHTAMEIDPDEDYIRAVHAAMQPDPSYVSHSLVSVDANKPVTVVAFIRRNQIPDYEGKTVAPPKQTWVTVVPRLKSFCQEYVKSNEPDPEQLRLRLKQRLGLPPAPPYDSFVELKVDPKDAFNFFRPCGDPSTSTNTCEPPSPPKPEEIREKLKAWDPGNNKDVGQYWVLSNYYWSFAPKYQYPWTALGYTFDWASAEDGSDDFVRWGESEFIIAPGAPIQFVSAADAVAYCTPQ